VLFFSKIKALCIKHLWASILISLLN
jgi:hypothetical protein